MKKNAFVDKSRVEPTIFFIEKISFSLKLFSGHFCGQSFIKTVRGPWASPRENLSSVVCEQHMRRPACAYAQSDRCHCYSLIVKYHIQA